MSERITVVLADDQRLFLDAVAHLLDDEEDIEILACVDSGPAARDAVLRHRPDVAVLDVEMPLGDGITSAAEISQACPETKIVVLTTFGKPGYVRAAFRAGVSAFVLKDVAAEMLPSILRRVQAGERVVDTEVDPYGDPRGVNPLSDREVAVLEATADGATLQEVARKLSLSRGTVRNYVSNVIAKTGARNRGDALRIARENGWTMR